MLCPKIAYGSPPARRAIGPASRSASRIMDGSGGSQTLLSRPGRCTGTTSTDGPSTCCQPRYADAPAPACGRQNSRIPASAARDLTGNQVGSAVDVMGFPLLSRLGLAVGMAVGLRHLAGCGFVQPLGGFLVAECHEFEQQL